MADAELIAALRYANSVLQSVGGNDDAAARIDFLADEMEATRVVLVRIGEIDPHLFSAAKEVG